MGDDEQVGQDGGEMTWRRWVVYALVMTAVLVVFFAITNSAHDGPLLTQTQLFGLAFGVPIGTLVGVVVAKRSSSAS